MRAGEPATPPDAVELAVNGGVAVVTLNRPRALNALDYPTASALSAAIARCAGDDAVRAVILTGAGNAFCAGGDMRAAWAHIEGGDDPTEFFGALTQPLHRTITDLRLMPKTVIAAVDGVAAGAGMSLAAACDLRLAGAGARFKQAYTSIGLVPDGGWTALVPQLIGAAKASELLIVDPLLTATDALDLGLVSEVVASDSALARARELAGAVAGGAIAAVGRGKALLNASLTPSLEAQLERERQAIMAAGASAEFRERLARFIGDRAA